MKRKLLIVSFGILIFACLFATTAFAAVDYSETITLADNTTLPIYDEDRNPLIWYVSGVDAEGNNIYKAIPNNRNEPNANNDDYVTYTINTSWMTQLENINLHIWNADAGVYETFTEESLPVVAINLRGLTNFQYINKGLKVSNIQYVYFNEVLKDFCDYFKGSTALRLVDLSVCTNLSGGFGGTRNFYNCTNLHTVRLAPETGYSLVCSNNNNYRFASTAIVELVIPSNITSLGVDNFRDCTRLESIYILGNTTSLGQRNFLNCSKLTNIYILGDNPTIDIISFTENFYECANGNTTYDFTGVGKYFFFASTNMDYLSQVKDAIDGDADDAIAVTIISYEDYVASPDSYKDGRYIIYGTSICDVYYGSHELDENNSNSCAGTCTVCGKSVMSSNPVHNYKTDVKYLSFLDAGTKTQTCQNDNCVHNTTPYVTSLAPLFTCIGYSAPETGDGGIAICFKTNDEAMTEYTKVTGKTLEYGVFAVAQEKLGDNAIFDENGEAASGVLSADVTAHGFSVFELKIVGFADEQKDMKLAMGAYVAVTDGEKTTYSYMQDDTKGELAKGYYFVSYNDVIDKTPSENVVQ